MRRESQLSLICPKCFTRSDATLMSTNGAIALVYDKDHVEISHDVTKGTLVPEPHCKHCPNPLFDHVRPDDYYMIMCDRKLGEIIQRFNQLGAYTQWSCEGHYEIAKIRDDGTAFCPEFIVPYIIFSQKQADATRNLYRASMQIDKSSCVTPVISVYDYHTGRRQILSFITISRPYMMGAEEYAECAQFGLDFDSKYWHMPKEILDNTLRNVHTISDTAEREKLQKEAIGAYYDCMQARQEQFIEYLTSLLNQYEANNVALKGGN